MKLKWIEAERVGDGVEDISIYVAKDRDGWRWKTRSNQWNISNNTWHGTASRTRNDAIESAKRDILNQSGAWADVYYAMKRVVGLLEKES